MFRLIKPTLGDDWVEMTVAGVISCVRMDESNTDYQRFLEWVAAGNEPEVIEA